MKCKQPYSHPNSLATMMAITKQLRVSTKLTKFNNYLTGFWKRVFFFCFVFLLFTLNILKNTFVYSFSLCYLLTQVNGCCISLPIKFRNCFMEVVYPFFRWGREGVHSSVDKYEKKCYERTYIYGSTDRKIDSHVQVCTLEWLKRLTVMQKRKKAITNDIMKSFASL